VSAPTRCWSVVGRNRRVRRVPALVGLYYVVDIATWIWGTHFRSSVAAMMRSNFQALYAVCVVGIIFDGVVEWASIVWGTH